MTGASPLMRAIRSPGALRAVSGTAPTSQPTCDVSTPRSIKTLKEEVQDAVGYTAKSKPGRLDRWLDVTVHASGSAPVFLFILAGLLVWAFIGIPFHEDQLWPILMSDVQAILSYVFDSFLMRQQLNGYYGSLDAAAELKSRSTSTHYMLKHLAASIGDDIAHIKASISDLHLKDIRLPKQDRFGKIISWAALVLGHIAFVVFYWITIFLWLGFGPLNQWSAEWELDINSATSALMVLVFSFLAVLRERHADYLRACLDAIYRVDAVLETKLRALTGYKAENMEVVIAAGKVNPVQRAINYYADIVGTLVGIAILLIVLIAWVCIGPALGFSSNWWLFIGTYAGLVGMNDGFVLRNVQARLREHEEPQYAAVDADDVAIFKALQLEVPSAEPVNTTSFSHRISTTMNKVCAHEVTVILGVLTIFGLLTGSSVLKWSETGQLLCNIPPSIIESFFMIILITGHNAADAQKRVDMTNVFERRRKLLAFVHAATMWVESNGSEDVVALKESKEQHEVMQTKLSLEVDVQATTAFS